MKNYKRAYRRYKQHIKFISRLKKWIKPGVTRYHNSNGIEYRNRTEVIEMALQGECYTFLRTTSNPCNCEGCTYLKYKRPLKGTIQKEIFKQICDDCSIWRLAR